MEVDTAGDKKKNKFIVASFTLATLAPSSPSAPGIPEPRRIIQETSLSILGFAYRVRKKSLYFHSAAKRPRSVCLVEQVLVFGGAGGRSSAGLRVSQSDDRLKGRL